MKTTSKSLTPQQWTVVKSLFAQALELEPARRQVWLQEQHHIDSIVCDEVGRLLRAAPDETLSQFHPAGPALPEKTRLTAGEVLLNRFRVSELLGSGAMGDVYRAYDEDLRESVAVKTLRSHFVSQPELVSRLRQEVQLARRVRHQNVCQILEFHQQPQHPSGPLTFFTMELLSGETLAARLVRGPMLVDEAEEIARGIAHGLEAIHAASLVHRDLKPGNIFLVESPAAATRVVITDFGLCFDETRPVTQSITMFGPAAVVGTPAYMAPEQLLGKGATQLSDVYAFGVVLFEMVTARLPFEGETALAIALRRLRGKAPSPRAFVPTLPVRWEKTILSCIESDTAHRPVTPSEVMAALLGIHKPPAPARFSRRQLSTYGVTTLAALAAGGWGYEFLVLRKVPHVPDVTANYHFKMGQEFAKQPSPDGIKNAIAEFHQAVVIDPKYAQAWAELADAFCLASNYSAIPTRTARIQAEDAAQHALDLDNRSDKAHAAYAYALSTDLKRWHQAEEPFRRALALDPKEPLVRLWYAAYLGRAGRFSESVPMAESALAFDPASFRYRMRVVAELYRARQFERLVTELRDVVRLHPGEASGYWALSRACEWRKRFQEAEEALRTAEGLPNKAAGSAFWATLYAASGRTADANQLVAKIRQEWLAEKQETNAYLGVLGALSRTDEIISALKEGIRREDETVLAAATNPYLDSARKDARYRDLLKTLQFDI